MSEKFLKLAEISSARLNSLERETTIFFINVSPLEDHGEHMPLGTDLIEGGAINHGVAKLFRKDNPDWHIVMCPHVTMGTDLMPGTGSIKIRQRVVRDFLIDYLSSLTRKKFKYFFISGFHAGPRHLVAIDEAVRYVNKKYGARAVSPFGYSITSIKAEKMKLPNQELQQLFDNNREDLHGGMMETSFLLFLRPELVGDFQKLKPVNIKEKSLVKRQKEWRNAMRFGYLGKPAQARPEIGEMLYHDAVTIFYEELCQALRAKSYKEVHRASLLSKIPFMKTNFFRKIMLAMGLMVFLRYFARKKEY